jgi:hypothetical protein
MTRQPVFVSDEAAVVWLSQQLRPTLMQEYLMWSAIWSNDPDNGRGQLPRPLYGALELGEGLFWEVLNREEALVQCYVAQGVRLRLEKQLEEA